MHKTLQALGRLKPGEMGPAEKAYADILEQRKVAGEVAWWAFEPVAFRLADRTMYHPDFLVMLADGRLEAVEVKGHFTDSAKVKIKVASALMPIPFYAEMVKKRAKRDGGGYTFERIDF